MRSARKPKGSFANAKKPRKQNDDVEWLSERQSERRSAAASKKPKRADSPPKPSASNALVSRRKRRKDGASKQKTPSARVWSAKSSPVNASWRRKRSEPKRQPSALEKRRKKRGESKVWLAFAHC